MPQDLFLFNRVMHSILLVIKKPSAATPLNNQSWLGITVHIEDHINNSVNNPNNGCTKRLGENVVLIDLNLSLSFFVSLTSKVQNAGFPYQVLFFEKEPQWIRYSSSQ